VISAVNLARRTVDGVVKCPCRNLGRYAHGLGEASTSVTMTAGTTTPPGSKVMIGADRYSEPDEAVDVCQVW